MAKHSRSIRVINWSEDGFQGQETELIAKDFESASTSPGKQITSSSGLLTCVFVDPNPWELENFHETHWLHPALKAIISLCSSALSAILLHNGHML